MNRRTFLGMLASTAAIPTFSWAETNRTLNIGVISAPNSLDPHFYQSPTNNQTLRQIFDPLVTEDVQGVIRPWLAESWQPIDETTWEFKLRPGIRFHDGTLLEPEDVAFSVERIPAVPNSPGSFTSLVRNVANVEVVDRTTIRIKSRVANPFLDRDFTSILLLSRKLHANAQTADFTSGKLAIGTGKFRFQSFAIGQQIELERNPDFWGERSGWQRVRTRFLSDAGTRVAGLLSGDIDLIDAVPVNDVAPLSQDQRIAVFGVASATSAYLFPDADRDQVPFITDKQGQPLDRNPFKDVRVRKALSLAIDRKGIVERLLAGQGTPADQFAPPPAADRLIGREPLPHDLNEAKRLLTEAGYPDGFGLTIHGPNGFFVGDAAVLQAVAQGFSRIGIETKVETLPIAKQRFFGWPTDRDLVPSSRLRLPGGRRRREFRGR